ncbi:MAG: DUF2237 domain-containing protein [Pseudomonadota bacterium]
MQSDSQTAQNVLGTQLESCGTDPMTGFFRDGCCRTGPQDMGTHVICAVVTDTFLDYSKSQGNDLISAKPEWGFPGLKSGDRWCLCVSRWEEARQVGKAPPVVLEATHANALDVVTLDHLKAHASANT